MSVSIEMRTVPARTLLVVAIEETRVFVEAWASDETEKQALRDIRSSLTEGTNVLVEATATGWKPETICRVMRVSWLDMYEKELLRPGNMVLVLHLGLKPSSR